MGAIYWGVVQVMAFALALFFGFLTNWWVGVLIYTAVIFVAFVKFPKRKRSNVLCQKSC